MEVAFREATAKFDAGALARQLREKSPVDATLLSLADALDAATRAPKVRRSEAEWILEFEAVDPGAHTHACRLGVNPCPTHSVATRARSSRAQPIACPM